MTRKGLWLAATTIAGVGAPASAATCYWQLTGTQNWTAAGGWSCAGGPTAADDVWINYQPTNVIVTLTGSRTARSIIIDPGDQLQIGQGVAGDLTLDAATSYVNGTLLLASLGQIKATADATALAFSGNGTIRMAGGSFTRGTYTFFGNVTGYGTILGTSWTNNGMITGDSAMLLRLQTASTAVANNGTVQASGTGAQVSIESAFNNNGTLSASGTGATLAFGTTTGRLTNLTSGGTLVGGIYTVAAGAIMRLPNLANGPGNILTIGDTSAFANTTINLTGSAAMQNISTLLESTLTTINRSAVLNLTDISTRNWNFANAGTVNLAGGTMNLSGSNSSTGVLSGYGTLTIGSFGNAGLIRALGGTLSVSRAGWATGTSTSGELRSEGGSTLTLTGTTAVGMARLSNLGSLDMGSGVITVATDYTNSGFGSGATWNPRANVTGNGAINAASGVLGYTGAAYTAGTLAISARVGGNFVTPQLRVVGSGTTTVRGTVNAISSGLSVSGPSTFALANGTSTSYNVSASGLSSATAGSTALGAFTVATNFDNVANQTVNVVAKVFQAASAAAQPDTITLVSRVGDAAPTATITLGNTASASDMSFVEQLRATSSISGNNFRLNGGAGTNTVVAGGAAQTVTLSQLSTAAPGLLTGTVSIANQSIAVTGSGLTNLTLANQSIAVNGKVYRAAAAGSVSASLSFAAARVGDAAPTQSLTVSNIAAASGGYTETLRTTLTAGAGFALEGGNVLTNAVGGASGATLSMSTAVAGTKSATISLANVSTAVGNSGLTDLALAGQAVTAGGKVYAPALAQVSTLAVDLGYVRPGDGKAGSVTLTNGATGALTDRMVTAASGSNGFNAGSAPDLTQGQSTALALTFGGSTTSGVKTGGIDLAFTSRNPDMADLALAGQSVSVTATVTELAKASLFKAGGSGSLTGSGTSYTLNLGNVWYRAGTVTTSFGLTNAIASSNYAEKLGGSWTTLSGSNAYSFSAEAVGLISAGASIQNGLLSFLTRGQSLGQYLASFNFAPTSHIGGLSDQDQQAIHVDVIATLVAVPEPAVWAQLIAGFGLVGAVTRRRRGRVEMGMANDRRGVGERVRATGADALRVELASTSLPLARETGAKRRGGQKWRQDCPFVATTAHPARLRRVDPSPKRE